MSQFQDAINHPSSTGQAKRAASSLQAGETVYEFSKAGAVELGELGEIEDDAGVPVTEQLIEGQFELFALDANLERPG